MNKREELIQLLEQNNAPHAEELSDTLLEWLKDQPRCLTEGHDFAAVFAPCSYAYAGCTAVESINDKNFNY